MSVTVGDVFELDGGKWAVKLVDLDGSHPNNKSKKPRIDASKFIVDEFGNEKVRKGRPSKFEPADVFKAMGLPFDESSVPQAAGFTFVDTANIPPVDSVEEEWEALRKSEEREARIAELIGGLSDPAPNIEW